ncbi:MAG: amidohydrolase family protein [bacterium]|nr:amidohydrolase family protein [bacterium]
MAQPLPRDIVIKNGTLVDGTGVTRTQQDVYIKGDVIHGVGDYKKQNAELVIDANGKFVVPGFIDIQSHSDAYYTLFTVPFQNSLVQQGITSIIMGNCGSSIAPLIEPDAIKSIQKWADLSEVQINWQTLGELYQVLEKRGVPLNVGTLLGHSTIRRGLLREEVRDLTEEELKQFRKVVDDAMGEGAFGLSFGLAYSHSNFVTMQEMVEIGRIVQESGGYLAFHLRFDDDRFDQGVNEVIEVAKTAKVPVHISHLRANGSAAWPKLAGAIAAIDAATEQGANITFNVYPYAVTLSVLYNYLPEWFSRGGRKKLLERIKNKQLRERVVEEMQRQGYNYGGMLIAQAPRNKSLAGKTINDMAIGSGLSIEETVLNTLLAADGQVIVMDSTLQEEQVRTLIKHPRSCIGTDAAGYDLRYRGELVHPRSFGTYPRIVAYYVRDEKILSLEAGIQKMTSVPAAILGLQRRGVIKPNNFADVVIFDPATIQDQATTDHPYRFPTGIEHVLVNGQPVHGPFKQGNAMAGAILRRGQS